MHATSESGMHAIEVCVLNGYIVLYTSQKYLNVCLPDMQQLLPDIVGLACEIPLYLLWCDMQWASVTTNADTPADVWYRTSGFVHARKATLPSHIPSQR